jgi:hypothetical protein
LDESLVKIRNGPEACKVADFPGFREKLAFPVESDLAVC